MAAELRKRVELVRDACFGARPLLASRQYQVGGKKPHQPLGTFVLTLIGKLDAALGVLLEQFGGHGLFHFQNSKTKNGEDRRERAGNIVEEPNSRQFLWQKFPPRHNLVLDPERFRRNWKKKGRRVAGLFVRLNSN